MMYLHEDLTRRPLEEKSGERALGITFAAIFLVIGLVRLYHGHTWWLACFVTSSLFFCLSCFWTAPLRLLNRLWHRLGLLLYHVGNPIAMGIVFFGTIVPTGLLMRIADRDLLKLKLDQEAQTYWEDRKSSSIAVQDMKNQF